MTVVTNLKSDGDERTIQSDASAHWLVNYAAVHHTVKRLFCLKTPFLTRDVIYTSRAHATMSVSVCLSVCDGSALAHYS